MGPTSAQKKKRKPKKRTQAGKKNVKSKKVRPLIPFWLGPLVVLLGLTAAYVLWPEKRDEPVSRKTASIPPPVTKKIAPKPPAEKTEDIILYFSDDEEEFLVDEKRSIIAGGANTAKAKAVLEALIRGSEKGLQPTIPGGTSIRRIDIQEDGTCIVDVSKEFQTNHPGGTSGELMTAYSIVQSLVANIPEIRSVRILVDGKPAETIAGHLFIGEPLLPDPSFVRKKSS